MSLKDSKLLRSLAQVFIRWGDNVRPIVQKPLILEILQQQRAERALDAGCGRGLYTPHLGLIAKNVDAIDINASHVAAQIRRQNRSNITAHNGSVTQLPFADETFDFVLFSEVMEHIEDDRGALKQIVRVMKTGGKLLISVPHPPAPIDDKEHVREGYDRAELLKLLAEYGFEAESVKHCMYGITKKVIQIEAWWTRRVTSICPAPLYWPLYLERWLPDSLKPGLPYDTIVLAKLTKASS